MGMQVLIMWPEKPRLLPSIFLPGWDNNRRPSMYTLEREHLGLDWTCVSVSPKYSIPCSVHVVLDFIALIDTNMDYTVLLRVSPW